MLFTCAHFLLLTSLLAAAALAAPTDRAECYLRAVQLDSELEDDGEALIEYVNNTLVCKPNQDEFACIKEDERVKTGIQTTVAKVRELGEMQARARGDEGQDVHRAMKAQLEDSAADVESVLDEMPGRTKLLFKLVLEAVLAASKEL